MKILRLQISNIASLPDATVDFEHGPLADTPVFLISGPTGSGKSTILNCICLALYNTCPVISGNKKSDVDSDNFHLTDPVIMVRKGAANAEIRLEFIANSGKRYVACWAQRKKRQRKTKNGSLSPLNYESTRTLLDVESNVTAGFTTAQAEQLTGLTYVQFTRTTLLAQGQFAIFLKAPAEEKAGILEKITGTEIYTQIGAEIFRIFNDKLNALNVKKLAIQELRTLSQEDKERMEAASRDLKNAVGVLEKKSADDEKILGWLRKNSELESLLEHYRSQLAQLQLADRSHDMQSLRSDVKLFDDTVAVRALITDKDNESRQLLSRTKTYQSLLTGQLPLLLGALVALKNEIEKSEARKAELAEKLKVDEPFVEAFARVETVRTLAEQVSVNLKEIAEKEKSLKGLIDTHGQLSLKEQSASKTLLLAAEEMKNAEKAIDALREKRKNIDLKVLNDAVDTPSTHLRHIADAENAALNLASAREDLKQKERDCAELESAINQSDKIIGKEQERHPVLEADYLAKTGMCEALTSIEEKISQIRTGLEATHTCPLCGTEHVQFVGNEALSSETEKARRERDAAKKLLDECDKRIADARSTKNATTCVLSSSKSQLESKALIVNKLQADFDAGFADVDLSDSAALQALKDSLNLEIEQARQALDAANRLISESDDAQKAFLAAASACTKAREDYNLASDKLKENISEQSAIRIAVGLLRQKISESIDAANEILPSDCQAKDTDIKDIGLMFSARAAEYLKRKTEIERLEVIVSEMKRQRDNAHTQLMPVIDSTQDVTPVVAALNPNLTADVSVFVAELSAAKALISGIKDKITLLERRIGAFMAENPVYQLDRLLWLNDNAQYITELRQRIKSHDDALLESRAQEQTILSQLARHRDSRPEFDSDVTQESVAGRFEREKAELDEKKAAIAKIESELGADAKLREEAAGRLCEIEALEVELAKWKQLNDLLGSKTNPRFRPIAQSYVLRSLLFKANHYLTLFSKRYSLTARPGTLTISVLDSDMPGTQRAAASLSGGESFLVSLALSLALASISKDKINVDTLFIDEGFGSLDSDSLSMVIDALDSLYAISNRRIGIISHVEILKERIPVQIRLIPAGGNASAVKIIP